MIRTIGNILLNFVLILVFIGIGIASLIGIIGLFEFLTTKVFVALQIPSSVELRAMIACLLQL